MLRDKGVESQDFTVKFEALKVKLDEEDAPILDSEYHRALKTYIDRLYDETCRRRGFTTSLLNDMREAEMSNLNRLQKLKNAGTYKKEKHRLKRQNEDWGNEKE